MQLDVLRTIDSEALRASRDALIAKKDALLARKDAFLDEWGPQTEHTVAEMIVPAVVVFASGLLLGTGLALAVGALRQRNRRRRLVVDPFADALEGTPNGVLVVVDDEVVGVVEGTPAYR